MQGPTERGFASDPRHKTARHKHSSPADWGIVTGVTWAGGRRKSPKNGGAKALNINVLQMGYAGGTQTQDEELDLMKTSFALQGLWPSAAGNSEIILSNSELAYFCKHLAFIPRADISLVNSDFDACMQP